MDASELPDRPPRREPMFDAPGVVIGLAVLFIAIYAAFSSVNPAIQDLVIRDFGFVPGQLTVAYWPARAIDLLIRANTDASALEQVRAMRNSRLERRRKTVDAVDLRLSARVVDTCHADTIWMIAFGPPVARRFGTTRFLVFMAATANSQRAGAVGQRSNGFRSAHRVIGGGLRVDGRGEPG